MIKFMTTIALSTVLFAAGQTTAVAGSVGGAKSGEHRVEAEDSDSFRVVLRGGEETIVYVRGDGDTDLDLFVYDDDGDLVASDRDSTDDCVVTVSPAATGKYRIVVRNLGSVYNEYKIQIEDGAPELGGPVGGAKAGTHRVEAEDDDNFYVALRAGVSTTIYVSGDGDTDLDLRVYDENGNLVGSDTDGSDECLVRVTPRRSAKFRINIENLGSVYNEYKITIE